MFCVHCGADGAVKFCAECGKSQKVVDSGEGSRESGLTIADPPELDDAPAILDEMDLADDTDARPDDWAERLDYAALLQCSEPRKRIAAAGRAAENNLTGDDLLKIFDAVSPIGVSWSKLTGAVVPIFDKLGFHTSAQAQGVFHAPRGRVLLAALCVLSSKSISVRDVHQGEGECSIVADIPLGIITNPGHLVAIFEPADESVVVSLSTRIKGQWYDWGKSKRLIDEVYAGIQFDLTRQQSGTMSLFRRVA